MSRRRKILIVVGFVFGGAILIPVIRHYQLKAKGEPMELAQVIPQPATAAEIQKYYEEQAKKSQN